MNMNQTIKTKTKEEAEIALEVQKGLEKEHTAREELVRNYTDVETLKEAIANAYDRGYEDGYDSGRIDGLNEGFDEGFDEGRKKGGRRPSSKNDKATTTTMCLNLG